MRLGMKRKSLKLLPVILIFFFVGVIISSGIVLKRAEPAFIAQTSNYSNTAFTDLVNKCVLKIMENGEYADLFITKTNSNEKITAIEADTVKINKLNAGLMIEIQNALNEDYPAYVSVPIGALTKYKVLSSVGPQLKFKIIPISVVSSNFDEEYESVGINQVRHSIYLDITVNMLYSGYTMHETELIETSVPITETIVMGDVPEYYGVVDGLDYQTE